MLRRTYIGLGSNLDDPKSQVLRAFKGLSKLPKSQLIAQSSLYESKPVGSIEQPDFINAVVSLDTGLMPLQLISQLQKIEIAHKRMRGKGQWGPRTLDLDLLLYGNMRINTKRLVVPHPHMFERNFVLYPLYEIAPDLQSMNGESLATLIAKIPPDGIIQLEEEMTDEYSFT